MSEVYIGDGYWRETDEPAARVLARQAIAERKMRLNESWMDEFERRQDELEKELKRSTRSVFWRAFLFGFAAGVWAAALLGGLL